MSNKIEIPDVANNTSFVVNRGLELAATESDKGISFVVYNFADGTGKRKRVGSILAKDGYYAITRRNPDGSETRHCEENSLNGAMYFALWNMAFWHPDDLTVRRDRLALMVQEALGDMKKEDLEVLHKAVGDFLEKQSKMPEKAKPYLGGST